MNLEIFWLKLVVEERNVSKQDKQYITYSYLYLLLTGLEKTLQKRWSSLSLLKMPCLKRNPALASPSGMDTGICTSDVMSSRSMANHLS